MINPSLHAQVCADATTASRLLSLTKQVVQAVQAVQVVHAVQVVQVVPEMQPKTQQRSSVTAVMKRPR